MRFPSPAVLIRPQKTPHSRCLKGSHSICLGEGKLKLLVTVDTIHEKMSLICEVAMETISVMDMKH